MPNTQPAPVFWITGFSGAGKTTIAGLLASRLRENSLAVIQLDGDRMRALLPRADGYQRADRLELAMSYARWCAELSDQGITVICATISMFHAVRAWNRQNIARYCEIYLRVSPEELARRDAKGLYEAARRGAMSDMVGLDLEPELPETPDLIIDNQDGVSPAASVERILGHFADLLPAPAHERVRC